MERHRDNIGVLRLLFASLVIVGHAPEMIDGDRSREPLSFIFHTVSLGELSVDAFFLISGYLITMSWLRTNSLRRYFERRVLRIYPAFIVAYLLSVFGLGAAVGIDPFQGLKGTILRLMALQPPKEYPGELIGLHYRFLNGAMWTIAYEFRCYILVAALGLAGLLNRRWIMLCLTGALLLALVAATFHLVRAPLDSLSSQHRRLSDLFGSAYSNLRLTTAFLVGACFHLFNPEISRRLTWRVALATGSAATVLLFHDPHLAEAALITLGAASLFWLGFKADLGPLQRINDSWDISYGVYLYGWPIATAIRWFDRGVSPWILAAATLPLALLAGTLSWLIVEKQTKDLARSRSRIELQGDAVANPQP